MKNTWFCYIKIDEESNSVFTSGMTFKDFMSGIKETPNNILVLKGFPDEGNWSHKLGFEYILQNNMESFIEEDVYSYGDFCWVDFQCEDDLEKVSNEELAELLYLAHRVEPLRKFTFHSLQNRYAYLCHDDDYIVKVYMNDIKVYKEVIHHKILSELKGRKRSIEPVPSEILDKLYDMFKGGAAFDFENAYSNGVNIYPIKKDGYIDDIHKSLDRKRNIPGCGICLDYNPRTKKWMIY